MAPDSALVPAVERLRRALRAVERPAGESPRGRGADAPGKLGGRRTVSPGESNQATAAAKSSSLRPTMSWDRAAIRPGAHGQRIRTLLADQGSMRETRLCSASRRKGRKSFAATPGSGLSGFFDAAMLGDASRPGAGHGGELRAAQLDSICNRGWARSASFHSKADSRASGSVRDHGGSAVQSQVLAFKADPVSSLPSGLRATGCHRGPRVRGQGAMSPREPACATRRASLSCGPETPRRPGGLFSARLGRLRARLRGFPPALDHPLPHRVRG